MRHFPRQSAFADRLRSGFTLIELLVVIAIIAILASIALPNYSQYLIRSRIPDATSTLANKRARLEIYFDNNRSYVGAPDCAEDRSSSRSFTFQGNCAASSYTLTATGSGPMAGFIYTVNEANAKATTGVPAGWTAAPNCWITGKGGVC